MGVPTVFGQVCPKCSSKELVVKKVKPGYASAVEPEELCGATICEVIQKHEAVYEKSCNPIVYKCRSCKTKFESLPVAALHQDMLSEPCVVRVERLPAFVGRDAPLYLYFNGILMMLPKRKGVATFMTPLKHNTAFVVMPFTGRNIWSFEATPGAKVTIKYKNGFSSGTAGGLVNTSSYSAYSYSASMEGAKMVYEQSKEKKKTPIKVWIIGAFVFLFFIAVSALFNMPFFATSERSSGWQQTMERQAPPVREPLQFESITSEPDSVIRDIIEQAR